ncbi:hypothetical protein [Synechococcus sp. RS9916]|uniref:hypothetical protein n=1 Tax=Synechococcus sp. RS9916 TaxID=221359 RepID=UPI0012EA6CA8|nr:hypothetical protein [Synechococcus sp. RS9916]
MTVESTGISAGKPVKKTEKKSDTAFFKIDTNGNRFASYNSSSTQDELKWDEATITEDELSANMSEKNELMEASGVLNIELQPPGQLTSQMSAVAFGMMTTDIDVTGDCEAIDESAFEEGLKKPSS